jgi:hypothetical protein|tara:strand:- start:931 stop:1137 length:207 start_codon:yes stop_codon:yes gene_type:complete
MTQVTINPNTNRLRQLCHDHGTVWWSDPAGPWLMPCFNGQLGLSITSLDGTHTRNVPFDNTVSVNHPF